MVWHNKQKLIVSFFAFFLFGMGGFLQVHAKEEYLIPMGHSIGIQMELSGVYLSGDVMPEKDVWLRNGDLFNTIDARDIHSLDDITQLVQTGKQNQFDIGIKRDDKHFSLSLQKEDLLQIIPMLKDRTEGTGTLTYVDPTKQTYGALGHQIIDSSLNAPPVFEKGSIFLSTIEQVKKSAPGRPGYKISSIIENEQALGSIHKNTVYGIFGQWNEHETQSSHGPIKVMTPGQLQTGEATIYTTVEGTKVDGFSIQITKINDEQFQFVLTDQSLIDKTGGVLQGMSGSPIIQNGKFAGAITHMFVDEPKQGAGLFIFKMRQAE